MKLKNLFFVDPVDADLSEKTKPIPKEVTSEDRTHEILIDGNKLNDVLATYDNEFGVINEDGVDFYEFNAAISKVGDADEKTFQVIQITLGLSKEKLLESAKSYIDKLSAYHQKLAKEFGQRMNELTVNRDAESKDYILNITELQKQIDLLQKQLSNTEATLRVILRKFDEGERGVLELLKLNDEAFNIISGGIHDRVSKIKEYLK